MPSTQELRDAWSPACQSKFRKNIFEAYEALDYFFKKYNYSPRDGETWGANCRPITGGSGYSLHAYRADTTFKFWSNVLVTIAVAVDVNSKTNPYGSKLVTDMPRAMVDEICALRTNSGHPVWGWGGYYSGNKDAMHYELHCFPAQLATGIKEYKGQGGFLMTLTDAEVNDLYTKTKETWQRAKNLEAVAERDINTLRPLIEQVLQNQKDDPSTGSGNVDPQAAADAIAKLFIEKLDN